MFSFFYFLLPSVFRPAFWWASPFGFIIRYHIGALKALLIPEIKERIQALKVGGERVFTLLDELILMKAAEMDEKAIEQCAEELCFMTFEGVGPMTLLLMQLIYEVVSKPTYIHELRKEISESLGPRGEWSEEALKNMAKLDSFTRETLRLNGPAPCEYLKCKTTGHD